MPYVTILRTPGVKFGEKPKHVEGQVCEVTEDEMKALINAGIAEECSAPKPVKPKTEPKTEPKSEAKQ